jgi:hypothetical protein
MIVLYNVMAFPFSWFWVASADATLAFAENGGVQTESKTGEIFWSFLAFDGKPENLRSVLLGVRRGEVTPKQGPRLRPER